MDNRKKIDALRSKIDDIDHQILDLYQTRLDVVREIAMLKVESQMEAEQPERLKEIREERAQYIEDADIRKITLEKLITLFHDDAVCIQQMIISENTKAISE